MATALATALATAQQNFLIIKKLVESRALFLNDDILRINILKHLIKNNVSPYLIEILAKMDLRDELGRFARKQMYNVDKRVCRAKNEDRKMFWNTHIHGMSRDNLISVLSSHLYYYGPTYPLLSREIDKIFKVVDK